MSFDDDLESALHPDDLGSIGEQDAAPTDPARIAPTTEPVIAPTIAPQPAAQTPFDAVKPPGLTTRQVTLSPAEQANLGALDENTAARKDTAEQEGSVAVDRAVDKAANAQAEADLKEQQAQQAEALQAQQRKIVEDRQRRDDTEYAKYREMGLKDPDANQSFGHRIAAALAIGLGQYSAAMNHTQNEAAHIFEQARRDNLELQKAAIEKQEKISIRAGKDVEEAKAEAAEAMHQLQVKNVAQIDAFKSRFTAESERLGIPAARIQASKTIQDIDKQALEAREKHLESTRTFSRDLTPKEARAGKGGGAGGGGAISELVRMKEAGASDGDIAARAEKLGIPPKAYLPSISNVNKTTAEGEKVDQRTVFVEGKPLGLVSSARQVKATEDRAVQYQDAIDSVKKLQAQLAAHPLLGRVPAGSDYDRAVLAVAATTQANASDKTTTHEAGTLKNYGLVSAQGLSDTLAHLERRQKEFMGQLQPLPERGRAAAGIPNKSSENAEPAKSDAERAKALISSPAFETFSLAKKAYLKRVAMGGEP